MTKSERRKRNERLIAKHMPKPWPAKPQAELVIAKRHHRGYIVETRIVDNLEYMGPPRKYRNDPGRFMVMQTAVTERGDYVGDPRWARGMCAKRGLIELQPRNGGKVCSIGFQPEERKWYGWSHRAICGFGIGDKIFEERMPGSTDETPFAEHGRREVADLHDAKLAASRFAAYVS